MLVETQVFSPWPYRNLTVMSLRLEEAEEGTLESNLPPCSVKLPLLPVIWVKWYKIPNSPMALNFTCSNSSDRERFLLNGPMAPSSKFQWAIQKINEPYHIPNGPFLTCIFWFLKVVQPIVIVFFLPAFIHTLQNILFSFK